MQTIATQPDRYHGRVLPGTNTPQHWSLVSETIVVPGAAGSGLVTLHVVPTGESGRKTHGGPLVAGPWPYVVRHALVIDNHGGTARERAEAPLSLALCEPFTLGGCPGTWTLRPPRRSTFEGDGPVLVEYESLTDDERDSYVDPAWIVGARIAGEAAAYTAASWAADGNSDVEGIKRTLALVDDGDPAADEYLPREPTLSGEMADDPTPLSLARDITGLDDPSPGVLDALAEAWENAVSETFMEAVETELRRHVPDDEPTACGDCGGSGVRSEAEAQRVADRDHVSIESARGYCGSCEASGTIPPFVDLDDADERDGFPNPSRVSASGGRYMVTGLDRDAEPIDPTLPVPEGVEILLSDADLSARLTAARAALTAPYEPTKELRRLVAEEARRGVSQALSEPHASADAIEAAMTAGEKLRRDIATLPRGDYKHAFSLYRDDVAKLLRHLDGTESASFDVDSSGFVRVYVAGREPLDL